MRFCGYGFGPPRLAACTRMWPWQSCSVLSTTAHFCCHFVSASDALSDQPRASQCVVGCSDAAGSSYVRYASASVFFWRDADSRDRSSATPARRSRRRWLFRGVGSVVFAPHTEASLSGSTRDREEGGRQVRKGGGSVCCRNATPCVLYPKNPTITEPPRNRVHFPQCQRSRQSSV